MDWKGNELKSNKPISFNGKNTSLMEEFMSECKKYGGEDDDEN